MGQILHSCASTTEATRRAIQNSEESLIVLSKRYGINPKTVAKWRARKGSGVSDSKMGSKMSRSVLSAVDEAVICAFRCQTLLPLDDCYDVLKDHIPKLSRSNLHRCLKRHGLSRLPRQEEDAAPKKKFKDYPIGFVHVDPRLRGDKHCRASRWQTKTLYVCWYMPGKQILLCRDFRSIKDRRHFGFS